MSSDVCPVLLVFLVDKRRADEKAVTTCVLVRLCPSCSVSALDLEHLIPQNGGTLGSLKLNERALYYLEASWRGRKGRRQFWLL